MQRAGRLKRLTGYEISRILHRYADFRIGATDQEKHCYKQSDSILLTFDDYGSRDQITTLLSILNDKGVRGMFFAQGDWARQSPELIKLIESDGHIIGNHSFSHRILLHASAEAIREEIINGPTSQWLRPPQGRYDNRVRAIASSLGYAICYWTIDSRDWTGASVETMRHTILRELKPNATILFHMNGEHTAELLPQLIDDIRRRGFSLTDQSEADWHIA